MGYLHAKGIVHKDLKPKNIFYENGKVVITDFGLFGISGVVQEGRRENELKLPHDWLCYLAPEIVREMAPRKGEDKLPFSEAADVYAFGTVWYELQAREWPFQSQPAEALIWQIGSGEGMKHVLQTSSLGKEVGNKKQPPPPPPSIFTSTFLISNYSGTIEAVWLQIWVLLVKKQSFECCVENGPFCQLEDFDRS
ncbi:kinase suppressor of Ras 1-like [Thamnophis elegans]|uniref:kinase suppressor of Ras 1-like n=1 Tax=Thamnophis elegans TaxID=35005 RepID=UPI0013785E93|nr:kinase suppressor of Ras 1-like [Thamnophis elegans]